MYTHGFPKLQELTSALETRLEAFPHILQHLRQNSLEIKGTFTSHFLTFAIDKCQLEISTRLFEILLLDGQTGYLNVLFRMIEKKQDQIMALTDADLQDFMHREILTDCVTNCPMNDFTF